ncbi:RpnC/YadD family protein [Nocardiopsis aegyptia]|uniref:Uncharacterized protein n=1 Tax=Nocardiopsis aegyptia TaxID=220378 RepID=A0A7Z0EQ64_9ACTN|nr:hypothetical protein [Nocardiopsis aegyptia]NYJ35691.1 hypothetical protein [Nocardiopsis aegyptia]
MPTRDHEIPLRIVQIQPGIPILHTVLNEVARMELERLMSVKPYEWQSDFAKKYVGMGREEGLEVGREEGRAAEAAQNVIAVLQARGFAVSDEERSRITSCTDLATLEKWVPKAVTVERSDPGPQGRRPRRATLPGPPATSTMPLVGRTTRDHHPEAPPGAVE